MRMRERLLVRFPVLPGTIRAFRSPSAPSPRKSVCKPVPRNNVQQKGETVQVHNEASRSSLPPKEKRDRKHRRERRAREREKITVSHLFMMRAGPISAH